MFPWIGRTASACWKPVRRYARMTRDEDDDTSNSSDGGDDRSQWSRDLEKHFAGEFSFSVVQGNAELEDHSQVETGPNAVFVGVYDGHGGPEAARFVRENLFLHHMSIGLNRFARVLTLSNDPSPGYNIEQTAEYLYAPG